MIIPAKQYKRQYDKYITKGEIPMKIKHSFFIYILFGFSCLSDFFYSSACIRSAKKKFMHLPGKSHNMDLILIFSSLCFIRSKEATAN